MPKQDQCFCSQYFHVSHLSGDDPTDHTGYTGTKTSDLHIHFPFCTEEGSYRVVARDSACSTGAPSDHAQFVARRDLSNRKCCAYAINASAGTSGAISPIGIVGVRAGGSQMFTITPDAGHSVLDVLVDGISVGAVNSYNFTNITANHSITANFIP